ncbi:uncharacterized protein [Diadema antillarum]|uniref:uncharacterized protein n=1 Tax=Diadema antillarum TaxID=105358 RepID=UPI003A89F46F
MASDSRLGKVLQELSQRSRDDTELTADLHSKLVQALSPSSVSSDFRVSSSRRNFYYVDTENNDQHVDTEDNDQYVDTEDDDQYFDVDLDALREAYHHIADKDHALKQMAKEIHRVYQDLGKFLCESTNRKDVRLIPILLECPTFDRVEEEWSREIVLDLARALLKLNEEDKPKFDILRAWWYQKPELFERIVRVFLKALQCWHGPDEYLNISPEDLYLKTLHLLYEINFTPSSEGIITAKNFYLQDLQDSVADKHIDIYVRNVSSRQSLAAEHSALVKPFSLADYPFLLPVSIKWKIACEDFTTAQNSKGWFEMHFMQGPARLQPVLLPPPPPSDNRSEIDRENVVESAVANVQFVPCHAYLPTLLVIVPDEIGFEIDRENVVESAIENVRTKATGEITEILVTHFINDSAYGVNGGGPMKELFQLFFDELLEPGKHHVFNRIGDPTSSTTSWFNKV